ncbi:hypothetical protein [Streptomyces lincolnensis]|uniref:hypothetical protein n=1 Tax=Streptomyces lincolnensis TaxID=1915 RepID=UPI0037D67EF0
MPVCLSNRRICRNCDGFPVVSITTGDRRPDGSRVLLRVICPACQGTGTTKAAPVVAHTGR